MCLQFKRIGSRVELVGDRPSHNVSDTYSPCNYAMTATKRIPVSPETWKEIGRMKEAGKSYDDLLQEMILAYNRQELARRAQEARRGTGEWIDLDDVG